MNNITRRRVEDACYRDNKHTKKIETFLYNLLNKINEIDAPTREIYQVLRQLYDNVDDALTDIEELGSVDYDDMY